MASTDTGVTMVPVVAVPYATVGGARWRVTDVAPPRSTPVGPPAGAGPPASPAHSPGIDDARPAHLYSSRPAGRPAPVARDTPLRKEAIMAELSEFPSASAKDTIAFCWDQVEGHKRQLVTSWVVMVLAVRGGRRRLPADLRVHPRTGGGPSRPLGERESGRCSGHCWWPTGSPDWWPWPAGGWRDGWSGEPVSGPSPPASTTATPTCCELSYRWHMDHPAGEVISSLGNFSWAFAELVDVASWGLLPVVVVVLSAIGVLAVVAWPAALALLVMVAGFVYVILRRLRLVREASQAFEDHHSRATGVVADTVTNLMAVRTAAAESHERRRVAALMRLSVDADLRARSIFMRTQLELESSIVIGTLLALAAGTTMAVHHWASTAALYLILYYSAQVALSLQQSFEHLRHLARSLGRAAKFTAIAGSPIEVTDRPGAGASACPGAPSTSTMSGSATGPARRCSAT